MTFEKRMLGGSKLPTKCDVIQYLLFLRDNGEKNRKLNVFISEVVKNIISLWKNANILIVSNTMIRKYTESCIADYYDIIKHPKKLNLNEWNKLFSVTRCKCKRECYCPAADRIPEESKQFFMDQCGPRLLSLNYKQMDDMVSVQESALTGAVQSEMGTIYLPDSADEEEFRSNRRELSPPRAEKQLDVSDIRLRNFSSALDRSDTSVRFGSLLATMLIKDLRVAIATKAGKEFPPDVAEILSKFLENLIVDKRKIQRERQKFRKEAEEAAKYNGLLKYMAFDGTKELTLKRTGNIRVIEEHVTIVEEPDSKFIGYVTPTEGTGVGIQKAITNFLINQNFDLSNLIAISCDWTVVNTGFKNGVIAYMERYLLRPLQWFVCLFHFNELPFNALLRKYVGKQQGPGIWPGEIGVGLQSCTNHPVVPTFEPIAMGEMPHNIDDWNIRDDQRYLFHMVLAVNNGECDEILSSKQPGVMSTARWLTTASRILRFYVTQRYPSSNLKKLTEFVVKIYAPFWFLIKSQPQAIHGSRHVFKYIHWIRQLPQDVQLAVRPCIENNAYFFHPENILLAMITNPDPVIRIDAYNKILDARLNTPGTVRQMILPRQSTLFDSELYTEMIDWNKFQITEPPCLQFYQQDTLEEYQYSKDIIEIPDFPCHSQNTERFVGVVHESAIAVTDAERLGHIFAKLANRERYSHLELRQNLSA